MAAFNKFNSFVEALGRKVHNLNADSLKVALSNSAPAAANAVLADITQIGAGNGYASGGSASSGNIYAQAAGTAKLTSGDVTFTASGGAMATFRYAVLYNDTAASKELIGWWDYGAGVPLADGESFVVDFDGVNGVLTVA